MENKTPKEILEEAYRDLDPKDRKFIERMKKDYKKLLEGLRDDKVE
jgi:hypothetical protein